jgi:hypothetical protein
MSTKWREETLYNLGKVGVPYHVARKLLRYGATLHRLAEAQCNGDYPADNGERKVVACTRCESMWVRSSMVRDYTAPKIQRPGDDRARYIPLICRDCRTEELIKKTCEEAGLIPEINGDPRGAVLTVKTPAMDEHERGIFIA